MSLRLFAATRMVTTTGVDSGDCTVTPCATPSYAIAQAVAGDTIDIGPGSFTNGGNPINVNKSLILAGEQFGVDARNRAATETVLQAPVVLAADNIVVDGFTVECGTCIGIEASLAPVFSGYQIRNNIVRNNRSGVGLWTNGTSQAIVETNWIHDNNVAGGSRSGIFGVPLNVLIARNLLASHINAHILVVQGEDLTITTNELINATGSFGAIALAAVGDAEVRDNVITGGVVGITSGGGNVNVAFMANIVSGASDAAMQFRQMPSGSPTNSGVSVTGNQFLNSAIGLRFEEVQTGGWEIHFNRIVGNTIDVFVDDAAVVVDAENNWWGCNEGPAVCATIVNTVGATVDVDPWLVMDIAANPATITVQQTSAVTSDLNQNSAGTAVSGFPNGVMVAFSTTNGTMAPLTAPTAGGAATSTFDPAVVGTATVSAALDEETVSTNVVVTLAATTVGLTSSVNPSEVGQPVTFTATVDPAATGTITFFDGATPLGTVPIVGGAAQLTVSTLTRGSHTITAQYSGDAFFMPATSAPLVQTVGIPPVPALSTLMLSVLGLALAAAAWTALRR